MKEQPEIATHLVRVLKGFETRLSKQDALHLAKEYAQIRNLFNQAIHYTPDYLGSFVIASVHLLGSLGYHKELRQWLEAALAVDSGYIIRTYSGDTFVKALLLKELGKNFYVQDKNLQQAEAYYQESLSLLIDEQFQDNLDTLNIARCYHGLGEIRQQQEQWQDALDYYNQALNLVTYQPYGAMCNIILIDMLPSLVAIGNYRRAVKNTIEAFQCININDHASDSLVLNAIKATRSLRREVGASVFDPLWQEFTGTSLASWITDFQLETALDNFAPKRSTLELFIFQQKQELEEASYLEKFDILKRINALEGLTEVEFTEILEVIDDINKGAKVTDILEERSHLQKTLLAIGVIKERAKYVQEDRLLRTFIEHESLADKWAYLQEHLSVLLSPPIDEILTQWIKDSETNKDLSKLLELHQAILRVCNAFTPYTTFKWLMGEGIYGELQESLMKIAELSGLLHTNKENAYEMLKNEPSLLLPKTESLVFITLKIARHSPSMANLEDGIEEVLKLLRHCREVGIERAFAHLYPTAKTHSLLRKVQNRHISTFKAFQNLPKWSERQNFAIYNSTSLLSVRTNRYLQKTIRNTHDPEILVDLHTIAEVFTLCSEEGIVRGFQYAEQMYLTNLLLLLIDITDMNMAKDLIARHPELIAPSTQKLISELKTTMIPEQGLDFAIRLKDIENLLQLCREYPLDIAFTRFRLPEASFNIFSLVRKATIVGSFIAFYVIENWEEKQQYVQESPELLGPDVVSAVEEHFAHEMQNNLGFAHSIRAHLYLLQQCSLIGIDAAFMRPR